jgi:hypothetical protein
MILASGTSQALDVVPDKPHPIAAKITDPRVNKPIFPSYGQQTYQAGWLHRMHLRKVKIE